MVIGKKYFWIRSQKRKSILLKFRGTLTKCAILFLVCFQGNRTGLIRIYNIYVCMKYVRDGAVFFCL